MDLRFAVIDQSAFAAKNLYNAENSLMQQAYIFQGEQLFAYETLYHQAKYLPTYQELPRKVAQQVLKLLQKNGKAFHAARKAWVAHPENSWASPVSQGTYRQTTGKVRAGLHYPSP